VSLPEFGDAQVFLAENLRAYLWIRDALTLVSL
jgi:hypothetical protein